MHIRTSYRPILQASVAPDSHRYSAMLYLIIFMYAPLENRKIEQFNIAYLGFPHTLCNTPDHVNDFSDWWCANMKCIFPRSTYLHNSPKTDTNNSKLAQFIELG